MANQFRLFFVTFSDGERVPLLTDQMGNPHWFATLFSITQIRNSGKMPNTTFAVLVAVRSLLTWAHKRGIQLEQRFVRREFLTEAELESLANHARLPFRAQDVQGSAFFGLPKPRRSERVRAQTKPSEHQVPAGTQHTRLSYIAKYLEWLATRLTERTARAIGDSSRAEIRKWRLH